MKFFRISIYLLCLCLGFSCTSMKNPAKIKKYVHFNTSKGDFVLGLYQGTKLHKENFINNCKSGVYDTCFLYYVKPTAIKKIGLKEGEIEDSVLINNQQNLKSIPAEINPKLINKTGAIGMLNSPDSKDSDPQLFYIVEGTSISERIEKAYVNKTNLSTVEKYIEKFISVPERKYLKDSLYNLRKRRIRDDDFSNLWAALRDSVTPLIKKDGIKLLEISEYQSKIYREIGGYPILDNKTTVFGEIVWNNEIFDSLKYLRSNKDYMIDDKIYFYNNKVMNKCQYKKFLKQHKK